MTDNNKVTIDAEWFAELYAKAAEPKTQMVECKGECQYLKAIAKERDELKAKLEDAKAHYCTNATGELGDACKVAALYRENEAKLAAAERCIENVKRACKNCKANINGGNYGQAELNMDYCIDAICAYRENNEATR